MTIRETSVSLNDAHGKEGLFRGYIQTKNKRSLQKFGHGEALMSWQQAEQCSEFAGVLNDKTIVIDIDNWEQASAALKIVSTLNLNCMVTRTTRGAHFIFRIGSAATKNHIHRPCALGLEVDIRCGTNAYIVLKQDDALRKVLREMDDSRPLENVPRWLLPVHGAAVPMLGLREGEGRNSTLFAHVGRLMANGFSPDEAKEIIHHINRYIFADPLPDVEMNTILRDEVFGRFTPASLTPYMQGENSSFVSADALKQLHPENNPRYTWTDIGAGRLFADIFRHKARYVPERKLWYCYDGRCWVPDIGGLRAMELCKALADALMVYSISIEDERMRNAYIEYSRKWQMRRNRDTILRDAQSVHPIAFSAFDKNPTMFNCANGTLFLGTMEFRPHCCDDLLTKITEAKYEPTARSERWERFIGEIMGGDDEKARFLQMAMGYGLSGDTRYECMFILYGSTTRNGKGTLCESILRVMGAYGCAARYESISLKASRSSAGPSEDIARLDGVRFVSISEPAKGLLLDAAQIKALTGGDTLNARFLHENSFDFRPQFKIYINTNHLPTINDMTLFASGRVIIVPFTRHFADGEQDKTLKHVFAKPDQQSAILNWLIEGYQQLMSDGIRLPAAVEAATDAYRHDSDKIGLFVEEALVPAPNAEERTSEVYARYRQWCDENGCYAENARNFKQAISGVVRIERRRPRHGGGATTMILGHRLATPDGVHPL